ncbi:MAG: hypothetical protein HFE75_11630 [Firmicutes bacterium]|jgi:hypothetical protein|nr:hypothetical protein [Bacillota bacterium]
MKNKQMERAIEEAMKNMGKRKGYDMSIPEAMELMSLSENDLFDAIMSSFAYGFTKGMRFTKAMNKAAEV